MKKSKEDKTIPKSTVFLEARSILYLLCWRLGNMNFLFQSNFQQHEIYKERPARFEGESSKNLKEEFTVFVKNVICIIMSDMILCNTRRGRYSCHAEIMLRESISMHHGRSHINIHTSRKVMHRESISMHHER